MKFIYFKIRTSAQMSRLLPLILLVIFTANCGQEKETTASTAYATFREPPQKYLPIAYWFWNGQMNPDSIRRQLMRMKKSGTVCGAVIMAWEGLEVKYLSDLWFDRVKYACDVANQLGLKIWLYDEILWPSGYAGGEILRKNPELAARCLARDVREVSGPETISIELPEKTLAITLAKKNGNEIKITAWCEWDSLRDGSTFEWEVPPGDWKIELFSEQQCRFHPTFQEMGYVDLLNPETAKKLIELTHEKYFRSMPQYFGNTIEAIITDEPGLYCNLRPYGINPGAIPFTPALFAEFKKMKKYDLRRFLPALWENAGAETLPVRVDFYEFLAKQFSKSYLAPLQKWCGNHKIKLNIQPVHEETMKYDALLQGDYFQVMKNSDIPGCDEVYNWDKTNLTPKLASSAARLLGENEIYCEVFGAYGWNLSLQKMKAVTDWLFARGVNRFQLSSFYFNTFNAKWRLEIPPSLFYQNTQWKYLKFFTDYLARLSAVLTAGKAEQKIALYRPGISLRGILALEDEAAADTLDKKFNDLANFLLHNQLDFLFVNDDFLANKSKFSKKGGEAKLQISTGSGNLEFEILLVPFAEILTKKSFEKIQEFEQKGGSVLWFGETPSFLLDREQDSLSERLRSFGQKDKIHNFFADKNSLLAAIRNNFFPDVKVSPKTSALEAVHSKLKDAEVYFISNHDDSAWQGKISLASAGAVEVWDPETGAKQAAQIFEQEQGRLNIIAALPPYGSKLFVVKKASRRMIVTPHLRKKREIELSGSWKFSPADNSFPEEIRSVGSWTEPQNSAPAHPNISGTGIYRSELELYGEYFDEKCSFALQIEDVREIAEVRVNGKLAGVRVWQPYDFDLTPFLRAGKNELEIRVTNTPANHYLLVRQNYLFGEKLGKIVDSGLTGKVKVVIFSK